MHDEPVPEALIYGETTGKRSFSRVDHCQYGASKSGNRRVVTPIRDATETPAECAHNMAALDDITLDMADLIGGVGVNIVPLVSPATVSMTVARAIEDVNPLCVASCDANFMDGAGRCRQHDNTNGVSHSRCFFFKCGTTPRSRLCPFRAINPALQACLCLRLISTV